MRLPNGDRVVPLTTVVDTLLAEQGNINRSRYLKQMVHAKWAWKDMLRMTVFNIVQMPVDVVDGRITLPSGVDRVIAVSHVDSCNNLVTLDYNPRINTISLKRSNVACSCKCQGQDTLCAMLDGIVYRTEEVEEMLGSMQYKKIWNRVLPCGELHEVTLTPVYDPVAEAIVFLETSKLLCKVEVTEEGCPVKTPENEKAIVEHCGCYMIDTCVESCSMLTAGQFTQANGQWAFEAENGSVIDVRNVTVDRLVLTCQLDGECESGMMVPEYAMTALELAIMHRQTMFAPFNVMPVNAKREAERVYKNAKKEMMKYLMPINADEFMALGSAAYKW